AASATGVAHSVALAPAVAVTTLRYGFAGPGDSPALTVDGSGALERLQPLLGGVLVTRRAAAGGDVWSYPGVHGDVVALADGAGAKQGPTRTYDPFGGALAGVPDNTGGRVDYGWLGQHQRGYEADAGGGVIEMGARMYVPGLGRFLEVDPVEGGSANDYDYVNGDPVNNLDLAGTMCFVKCGWGHVTRGVKHVALNFAAVPPYLAYYASYKTRRAAPHWMRGPLVPLKASESLGLWGDQVIDRWKGESVRDEGTKGYITPWHSWTNGPIRFLRGPYIYLPGIHGDGRRDYV
ncbi:MAG: hypothetical protein QOK43_2129, partial [Acidimicrobiaceae bacterium]|nr:hypothetical protein [Acidimicrobiaceae bacterium]